MLIQGRTKKDCETAVSRVLKKLQKLGIVVNLEKSVTTPSQIIEYLGFQLDSKEMMVKVPTNKVKNLKKELRKFNNKVSCSPRDLASRWPTPFSRPEYTRAVCTR